ncbi:MAG: cytochrome c-type biogenesis protein CcmH [bacterium]|nr:cytochrome c-type biogenesis protein CcmH [bacterium]
MNARAAALCVLLATTVPALAPAAALAVSERPTQAEMEEALTCQCGCGLTVHSCNHLNCGSGEPIKKEIAERLARGETGPAILAAFEARFGEKILSAPTFRGFNWLAWVTPFLVVFVAGSILAVTLRRRARAGAPTPVAPSAPPPAGGDPALRDRLARELKDLDRD